MLRGRPSALLPLLVSPLLIAVMAALCLVGSAAAQDEPQGPPSAQGWDPEGLTVRDIQVEGATQPDLIVGFLRTKVGEPFRGADVTGDLERLWKRFQVVGDIQVEPVEGGVRVFFVVEDSISFDRHEFRGYEKFTEKEIRTILRVASEDRLNRRLAEQYAATLRDRYRREGYAFVQVRIEEDRDRSILTFWVDEGPLVTVRTLEFIGNESFPGWAPVQLFNNLEDSADLKSKPRTLSSDPYDEVRIEEDLDRLRFFYRKKGYRDAQVELAGVVFSANYEKVDITIQVEEGRRYRVGSVAIEQRAAVAGMEPLYPNEELLELLDVAKGDWYDWDRIQADEREIGRYYGKRGHPRRGQYGTGLRDAFDILDPKERFDPENGVVHLTYVIEEGTPKKLRDVVIRGNQYTQDRVIRRNVFVRPGETLDMTEVERSLGALDSLRYFQDPTDFRGVRFALEPVAEDPELVDLEIGVQEGDTGELLWGAGISTQAGVQGRIVLSKRNFDYTQLPESYNPIDWIIDITENKAFHGAGQNLELMLAPGTQISLFQLEFFEPDLFRSHFDTIGLRLQGYRRLQFFDSFNMDALGGSVGLQRAFTEKFSVGTTFRQESVEIDNIDGNAPSLVFDAEGTTEMRGLRLNTRWDDVDFPLRPADGHRANVYGEVLGGPFGADEDLWKAGADYQFYYSPHRDSRDRPHTLRWRQRADFGGGYGRSDELFLSERFYMGGNNLRGFDQRRAGPFQFAKPVGGRARLLSSLEYRFPLVSTQRAGQIRHTEVLRGVVFVDAGMLGLRTEDMGPLRLSAGVGVRIQVPVLNLPIALDLGWPILSEDTDEQRQFSFSLARF